MDLIAKLPDMADDGLANLRENAERLQKTGTSAQRSAAADLLPAIDAELENRQEAKRARLRAAAEARRAAKPATTSKAKKPAKTKAKALESKAS